MALTSQDFETWAGQAHTLNWIAYQSDGTTPLDITNHTAIDMAIQGRGTLILWQLGAEITVTDGPAGKFDVVFNTTSTAGLAGSYGLSLTVTDNAALTNTIATGVAYFIGGVDTNYASLLDLIGQTGMVSVGGASYRSAREISPRARRHLASASLLSRQLPTSTGNPLLSEFFDE